MDHTSEPFEEYYEMPISKMTDAQKEEAWEVFNSDLEMMTRELSGYIDEEFGTDDIRLCDQHYDELRELNKLVSQAMGRSYELLEISKKQRQKEAA